MYIWGEKLKDICDLFLNHWNFKHNAPLGASHNERSTRVLVPGRAGSVDARMCGWRAGCEVEYTPKKADIRATPLLRNIRKSRPFMGRPTKI